MLDLTLQSTFEGVLIVKNVHVEPVSPGNPLTRDCKDPTSLCSTNT